MRTGAARDGFRFALTDEQREFGTAVRDLLADAAGADADGADGGGLWSRLAGLGVPGVLVPEAHGGLGGDETDLLAVVEEAGAAALAEPLAESLVATRLIGDIGGDLAARWLPEIASGALVVAAPGPYVPDADRAALVLVGGEHGWHAVPGGGDPVAQPSIDPARRLFAVRHPADAAPVASGAAARAAYDRGATLTAVYLVGVARRLIETTVAYATERVQYGRPIGSFQAIKHRLADLLVEVEFARPMAWRAAYALATDDPERTRCASAAKAMAADAAAHAARAALQIHGAIGYTQELGLHRWLRRAWTLAAAWGDAASHRRRIAADLGVTRDGTRV